MNLRRVVRASLMSLALLGLAALLPPGTAALAATDAGELAAQISELVTATYKPDEPGAAMIVVRQGEVLHREAVGMANLELGAPLEPDMVFRLGSITKQFTGAAIALLEDEGKLSVGDPITRFLPDYPTHGHEITIAHLLAHTSGIRSYTGIPGWMESRIKSDMTLEELIDGFAGEPMDFAPGARFLYNNSGYVLLGAIIEEASGRTYEEFLTERIFEPLGMKSSYYGSHSRVIPRRAAGYDGTPGDYRNAQYLSMTQPHAAGALVSTVDDLATWNAALFGGKLLGAEAVGRMTTPFELNDGTSTGYGYGLGIGELRGRRMISHGGGIFGFSTYALHLPEEEIFVAVLSNNTADAIPSPGLVARKIAALVMGDPFPEFTPIELEPEVLSRYTGVYRIDEETTRTVTLVEGKLYTQRSGGPKLPIAPHSQNGFFYERSLTHLSFIAEKGKVTHMLFYPDGSKEPELVERTDEPLPEEPTVADVDPRLYDDYVGRYEIRPGFELTISRGGDRLFSQVTGGDPAEIFPSSETEFFSRVSDARFTFERDPAGRVDRVIIHRGAEEIRASRLD